MIFGTWGCFKNQPLLCRYVAWLICYLTSGNPFYVLMQIQSFRVIIIVGVVELNFYDVTVRITAGPSIYLVCSWGKK